MNKKILSFIKDFAPPLCIRLIKRVWNNPNSWYFKGNYLTWADAKADATGYDSAIIFDKVLNSSLKVKNGEAACERDSVVFDKIQYSWPLLASLMWVAAKNKGKLTVLDFGGSLGSTYFQNKKYLDLIPNLSWNIVEQKHYVEAGNSKIASDKLKFYETIDDCISQNKINVVVLSGVLDLIENPYEVLDKLFLLDIQNIILDRSAFFQSDFDNFNDKIVLQIVPKSIFKAKLPFRILSWLKMLNYFKTNGKMNIIEEYETFGYQKGKDWEFKGFLASKD